MGSWRRVKHRGKPAIKQSQPTPLGETRVIQFPRDELVAREREAGAKAIELGKEVEPLLAANGIGSPRQWTQKQLRALIFTLRDQGDLWEAYAVEKYADARLEWSQAIGILQGGQTVVTLKPDPKFSYKTKASTPKHSHRPTDFGCHGRKEAMPPIEDWHATTPPWEDRPVSPQDAVPIRLVRRTAS